jgi:RNA polymerase sigma-70 factor (ECF subfamily)
VRTHEEQAIATLLEASRALWPHLTVDERAFELFVASQVERSPDPAEAIGALHGPDLYIAFACAAGDATAIAAFEKKFLRDLPSAIGRMRLKREDIDEIKQVVRKKLLVGESGKPPKILEYAGRGPLESWVRVVAVREALTLLRKTAGAAGRHEEDDLANLRAQAHDPELALIQARHANDFRVAIQTALGQLSMRERTVLRLHFCDGLNIDQIGVVYRVHRATVARWIARAREQLLETVRKTLRARLGVSGSELNSLLVQVRSQIDVSVQRLLKDDVGA